MSAPNPASYADEIRSRLKQYEQRQSKHHDPFICESDLHNVWSQGDIESVLPSAKGKPILLKTIKEKLIKILSILVYSYAFHDKNVGLRFMQTFFELGHSQLSASNEPLRKDDDLPFGPRDLPFLSQQSAEFFCLLQYIFIPVKIEESVTGKVDQSIDHKMRLPFIHQVTDFGSGAYGTVDKVTIAPGYYLENRKKGLSLANDKSYTVACKRIRSDGNKQQDFEKEVRNLQFLKESLTQCGRVMLHLTALRHGPDFLILLPFAEFADLEVFFNLGMEVHSEDSEPAEPKTIYNFREVFPGMADNVKHRRGPLLKEAIGLINAIEWLHDQLKVPGESDLYCAHMDLKPDNILIDNDSQHPVGKWMISDFGISVFKSFGDDSATYGSIRDVTNKLSRSTMTRARRNPGIYQAPEVQSSEKGKVVGRSGDIWSLGCLLTEVIVFAVGWRPQLQEFRNMRAQGPADFFYETSSESWRHPSADHPKRLKDCIPTFLQEEMPQQYPEEEYWLRDCVRLILGSMLVTDAKQRKTAKEIGHQLENIRKIMEGKHRRRLPRQPDGIIEEGEPSQGRTSPLALDTPGSGPPIRLRAPLRETVNMQENLARPMNAESVSFRQRKTSDENSGVFNRVSTVPETWDTRESHTFPVPPKSVEMALSSEGDMLGVLSKNEVSVHETKGDSNTTILQRPLPPNTTWTHITIASGCVAVWGVTRGRHGEYGKSIYMFDLRRDHRGEEIQVPPALAQPSLSDIIVTNETAAFTNESHVDIFSLGVLGHTSRVRLPSEYRRYRICKASLSANGEWLFAWAQDPGRADHYFWWKVTNTDDGPAAEVYGLGKFNPDIRGQVAVSIWPALSTPVCLVKLNHQIILVSGSNTEHLDIPDFQAACLRLNDRGALSIIYVPRKRRENSLYQYNITDRQDTSLGLNKNWKPEFNDSTKISSTLPSHHGRCALTLCTKVKSPGFGLLSKWQIDRQLLERHPSSDTSH